MDWTWIAIAACCAVMVPVAVAAICEAIKMQREENAALPKISISNCRKCGEVLGPQKRETVASAPGENLHFVVTCGHCGTRFLYSRWGDFECER